MSGAQHEAEEAFRAKPSLSSLAASDKAAAEAKVAAVLAANNRASVEAARLRIVGAERERLLVATSLAARVAAKEALVERVAAALRVLDQAADEVRTEYRAHVAQIERLNAIEVELGGGGDEAHLPRLLHAALRGAVIERVPRRMGPVLDGWRQL